MKKKYYSDEFKEADFAFAEEEGSFWETKRITGRRAKFLWGKIRQESPWIEFKKGVHFDKKSKYTLVISDEGNIYCLYSNRISKKR